MRIVAPTFEKIEWMPPTITLFRELASMGHEIVYITIYPDTYFAGEEHIHNISLKKREINFEKKIKYIRGISGLLFRLDNLIKKSIAHRKLNRAVKKELREGDLLWVVNEMTVLLAGTHFLRGREYFFTCYELHERTFSKRNIEKAMRGAKCVIVPEYHRAHIMKSRYRLQKLPIVLPNKSPLPNMEEITYTPQMDQAISRLKEYREKQITTILYMGGITPERPLEPLLSALNGHEEYRLVLVGRESGYLHYLQNKYPDRFDYLGGFVTPNHLVVARYASIGLIVYISLNRESGLNALFCAPNKIYEYTGLGLPVIANDIPGLKFEVTPNGIGEVVDFDDPTSVIKALNGIKNDYDAYTENAKRYYEKTDITKIIRDILANA